MWIKEIRFLRYANLSTSVLQDARVNMPLNFVHEFHFSLGISESSRLTEILILVGWFLVYRIQGCTSEEEAGCNKKPHLWGEVYIYKLRILRFF